MKSTKDYKKNIAGLKHVEILEAEQPDEELDIPNGIMLKKNYIGTKNKNFGGFLVLAHFKGHAMRGLGGALKQLL